MSNTLKQGPIALNKKPAYMEKTSLGYTKLV